MIRIAICDDNELFAEKLEKQIEIYFENKKMDFKISKFTNSVELYSCSLQFDIYLLDIEMPDVSGMEIARKITDRNENAIIFFITDYENYLDEAFDIHAFRYLYKPLDEVRFNRGLDLALQKIQQTNAYIMLHIADKLIKINMDEIIYITIENRKCRVVITNGYKIVDDNLKNIYANLPVNKFAYTHKSYIVNLSFVKSYDAVRVILQHKSDVYDVYMSRRMLPEFKKKFILYARGAV